MNYMFQRKARVFLGLCIPLFLLCVTYGGSRYNQWGNPPYEISRHTPRISYDSHSPIAINGNPALAAFPDKSGSGTEIEPYIIENLAIDAGGTGSSININNTDRWLIVQNCMLTGATSGAGGRFINCSNLLVINCTSTGNNQGLFLNGTNVHVVNCTASGNGIGIFFWTAVNSSIIGNTVTGTTAQGIFIEFSPHCTISANNVSYNPGTGLYLWENNYTTLLDNEVLHNSGGGITLFKSCHNIITRNRVCFNTGIGFYIYTSNQNNSILLNNITGNMLRGMEILTSETNIIQVNILSGNGQEAIQLESSSNNIISRNWIWANTYRINESTSESPNFPNNWWFTPVGYDEDGDGLLNEDEFAIGTNPDLVDSDGDTLSDGIEVTLGTDPLVGDTDGDGYDDGVEHAQNTDPTNPKDFPSSNPNISLSTRVSMSSGKITTGITGWITDVDSSEGTYTIYLNGTPVPGHNGATWSNNTGIFAEVDTTAPGLYNFTLIAGDGVRLVQATAWVEVVPDETGDGIPGYSWTLILPLVIFTITALSRRAHSKPRM